MLSEIGSEFWIEEAKGENGNNRLMNKLSEHGEVVLTSSGRGAISLLLEQISPRYKSVLMPAYICDSVILPFIEQGYSCYFYEIEEDFTPNIDCVMSYGNIGVFLHMGYYGFSTNSNLVNVLENLKKQSVIIIEDITHTLFSDFKRFEENDFYVGSIRKWFGLPTGGFLASSREKLRRPLITNDELSKLRKEALLKKGTYMKTNDESLKGLFLNQFSKAEILLDRDVTPYCIDDFSSELINLLNVEDLINVRRGNFNMLSDGLRHLSYLELPFEHLQKNVCPMFYPIIINKNRNDIRKLLIDEKIYCPVHWPVPDQIKDINLDSTLRIYDNILSIPCDQRYGISDMEKIITVFNKL